MIEGLHFDVSADEVVGLLGKRIEQCERKAQVYGEQAEQQRKLTEALGKDAGEDIPKHSTDQSANLDAKSQEYEQKAKQYRFLRDHVVKGEVYRLGDRDMKFLGVIDRDVYW